MRASKSFPNMKGLPDDIVLNFKNKEYDICKEKCKNILISNPNNGIALVYLGHIAESEKDYETSIKYFKRVTEIEPSFPFIWSRIGEIYSELEKFSEACEAFTEEIALMPSKASPWCLASMSAQKSGRHDLAIGLLKLALEKVEKEGQSIIYFALGSLEEIAGNNNEALVHYMQGQMSAVDEENKNLSAKRIYKMLTKNS